MTVVATVASLAFLVVLVSHSPTYAKYSNSQAQSFVNECLSGDSGESPFCLNGGPQIQADGSVSSPMNTQVSNGGGQGEQEVSWSSRS